MRRNIRTWLVRALIATAGLLLVVAGMRAWQLSKVPDLAAWHKIVPDEPKADEIDALDWDGWARAEDALFATTRQELSERIEPADRVESNRYFEGSPINGVHFQHDWNRSFVLRPEGPPVGAVVLLHGLTDAPYSLAHIAQHYVSRGYVAVGIRLPGHGTVPGALTRIHWQDWSAATRLAVRTAVAEAGPGKPLHIVGYSNGAALAVKYSLEALEHEQLARADRLILLSPMIGLTRFARYAGLAGWPAIFPAFAKTAWLDVIPEFNPYKYNSFPVRAARESWDVTAELHERLQRAVKRGDLDRLPPILAFQSAVDATVSTPAVLDRLFTLLPANGSEIVFYDVNRFLASEPLLTPSARTMLEKLLPTTPQVFDIAYLSNSATDDDVYETRRKAGSLEQTRTPIGVRYPRDFFSLSHIALPFPLQDSVYGTEPEGESYGVHLGTLAVHAERGVMIAGSDLIWRPSSNPFYAYQLKRIDETIPGN